MSFNEYIEKYGTNLIEAICYKNYQFYIKNNKIIEYQDFVQESLINLIKKWKHFDSEKGSINTFITINIKGLALTIMRDAYAQKRKDKMNEFSIDYTFSGNSNKDMNFENILSTNDLYTENEEFNNLVNECCSQIKNEKHKLLFKMYLEGYSYEEIGKVIDMKTVNVNSTCQRIRRKFKEGYYRIG